MNDLILFNMSTYADWLNGVQNRNYWIFQQIKKDHDFKNIILVDFLPFNFKQRLRKIKLKSNYEKFKLVYKADFFYLYEVEENLYLITFTFWANYKNLYKFINEIIELLNLENIWEWHYNVISAHLYLNKIKNVQFRIFDAVDNWLLHISYQNYKERLLENYELLVKNSDITFTVASKMQDFLSQWSQKNNIYFIPNASSYHMFLRDGINNADQLAKLENIKRKYKYILGYIGVIQSNRFSVGLLEEILDYHQDKAIVLAGPIWKDIHSKLIQLSKQYNNLFFLGFVKKDDWPYIAEYFDLALSPHLENDFMQYISPTKIYEYLAIGLPVITSQIAGLENLLDFVYLAKNNQDFIKAIDRILEKENKDKQELRKTFIKAYHLWEYRYKDMKNIIKNVI